MSKTNRPESAKIAISRKDFLVKGAATLAAATLPGELLAQASNLSDAAPGTDITVADLAATNKLSGLDLTDPERRSVLEDVVEFRRAYESIRKEPITNSVAPSLLFTPLNGGSAPKVSVRVRTSKADIPEIKNLTPDDIAFLSIRQLGALIRSKAISSTELTRIYLDRLKKYGDGLLCLVTLTEELALREAKKADEEISKGQFRGPLHGIPYGVKDLFAVRGYPTTWGANTFEHQVVDTDAAVVERLRDAGAVLCAKLSMGALAQGDVWFKGRTQNPWDRTQGSSGSSAGSACATAAGLVAFAIGTETLGSIVSPSVQCRVTGLRPTFGRVSRYGAMELSWTMDKVGPICREVEDAALVLSVICGHDPRDPSSVSRSFEYSPIKSLKGMKIGLMPNRNVALDADPLYPILKKLGADVQTVKFTPVPDGIQIILDVDSGSAFDEFTRSGMVRSLKNSSWPETFRASRFVTAVEYLQAQRARTLLMHRFEAELGDLDALVGHDTGRQTLVHTNYTGHPQLVIPQAPDSQNRSHSIAVIGRLYEEGKVLQIGRLLQEMGDFHRRRPKL